MERKLNTSPLIGMAGSPYGHNLAIRWNQAKGTSSVAYNQSNNGIFRESFFKGTVANGTESLPFAMENCYAILDEFTMDGINQVASVLTNQKADKCYLVCGRARFNLATPADSYPFYKFSRYPGVNCYYNNDMEASTNSPASSIIGGNAASADRKAMQSEKSYEGWDFENIWTMEDNSIWL